MLAKCAITAYFIILLIAGKQIPAVVHGTLVIPNLI
jgi:hypothetical protein